MKYIFYDTCSLLTEVNNLFKDSDTMVYISSITISELEGIKSSKVKDEEVKYAARQVIRTLETNAEFYDIVLYQQKWDEEIERFNLPFNNDSKIVISAYHIFKQIGDVEKVFATKDLNCRAIARSLGIPTQYLCDSKLDDVYCGYQEIVLDENELAEFYETTFANRLNPYSLVENEYLIIKNTQGDIVDYYKWKFNDYKEIPFKSFDSKHFGNIKPMHSDIYQKLAFDAVSNNQITVLRGPAGSGKSMIALSYMFHLLENGYIQKIVIFCNTVATRGAARLGFLPGTRTEKLLDSQIGNFLESKIGDRFEVEELIKQGKILILPMSDIRGFDTTGMNAAIYITEAQNTTIDLMKLALQRIGGDSICILDGDDKTQVDLNDYAGSNNGLRRVSQVFRGESYYGEVTLRNVKRSKIAARAELM